MLREGQPDGGPSAETAGQILRARQTTRRSRAASRAGLAAAVIVGLAIAAAAAGLAILANTGGGDRGPRAGGAHAQVSPAPALRVVSVLPADRTSQVNGDANVQIALSSRLARNSAVPSFQPAVPGQWQASGTVLSFTPSVPFAPHTRYTLHIPAGKSGLRSFKGGLVAKPTLVSFRTAGYSQVRLAQVLSQLGYLPLSWHPDATDTAAGVPAAGAITAQEQMAFSPPVGSYTWDRGYPATLRALWVPGRPNVVVLGAVMAFQAQHNLAINGAATKKFWQRLFVAAASSNRNRLGYTYAIARKGSPEMLTIWHNGQRVLRSLTNTGIPVAPTVDGSFPVYRRYRFQIMSGTNPDGSHYADPVSYVAYFHGGDAVHYFARVYGAPQSLGCVELPYDNAKRAWPFLTYGSLVTVTG